MPLPTGLNSFTLTFGDYNKVDGSEHSFAGMKGILSVTPPIVATASGSVLIDRVEFFVGNDGTASIASLVPNDDPGINQGTAYAVEWQARSTLPAPPNKTFVVRVADGASVDYDKLTAVTGTVAVPPPGVNSVNGKTGSVTLTASDVGAAPAGSSGAVASVNTKTGTVVLSASDVGADASGAATAAQAFAVQRANHTGTQSADTITDGTTNKAYTATEKTKLAGIATGATANSTDATLLSRANHTGTQAASTVTGLATVATTGAYTDLSAKPTIPTVGAAGAGAAIALSSTDASVTNARTPTAHTHPAADLTATGTRDATTFLRGDNTWAAASGGTSLPIGGTTGQVLAKNSNTDQDAGWKDGVQLAVASSGQDPVAAGTTAGVGSQAVGARADHVHPSAGMYGWLGSGKHGAAVFDGTTTVTGCSLSGGAYTATGDLHLTSATFSSGITVDMAGFRMFVRGAISVTSGTATVTAATTALSGANQSGTGAGLTQYSTYNASTGARTRALGPGSKGAAGVTGVGATAPAPVSAWSGLSPATATSGSGGAGASGAGGAGIGTPGNTDAATPLGMHQFATVGTTYTFDIPNAWNASTNTLGPVCGGRGGGSGAGDGTNAGGAGGCGGNVVLVNAKTVTGTLNVTAPGGAGGTPTTGNCGGGGGGTGGVALLNATGLSGWTGAVTAPGGAGGSGVGTGAAGNSGGAGFAQATTWL